MNRAARRSLVLIFPVAVAIFLAWRLWPDGAQARRQQRDRDLIQAVRRNDLAAATRLLGEGADPNMQMPSLSASQKAEWYYFGIMQRIRQPNANYVADLDVRWSLLQYAVVGGRADVVNVLLLRGADTNYRDKAGDTALLMAKGQLNSSLTSPQDALKLRRIIALLRTAAARPRPLGNKP